MLVINLRSSLLLFACVVKKIIQLFKHPCRLNSLFVCIDTIFVVNVQTGLTFPEARLLEEARRIRFSLLYAVGLICCE